MLLSDVLAKLGASREQAVSRLIEFLRIPSVSTDPQAADHIRECANWLAKQFQQRSMTAQVMETRGHPVVVARSRHLSGRPTVLFYGHYDVQPAEPLELWHSPPFQPEVRDGAIYARGACDDKGQLWAHVEALAAWSNSGGVPVNVVALIEGEEEIGSPHLAEFIEQNKELLKADVAVVSDSGQFARGLPAITYGLRGLVYEEIFLEGPGHDLHSGMFGGAVPNPANVLSELLASLHDRDGRVNIPGFYDDVRPLERQEREMWSKLPFDEGQFARELGLPEASGERGFSTLERRWARPTCDVNGITAGYQGEGAKTVIPSKASAKVSMRLVPNQDPLKVRDAFEKAVRERCPGNVKVRFANHGAAGAIMVPLGSRAMSLAAEAVKTGFGVAPAFIREGGSIPIVGVFRTALGVDTLLVGFSLPDDRPHSPNEKFDLDSFYGGMRTAAALYDRLKDL